MGLLCCLIHPLVPPRGAALNIVALFATPIELIYWIRGWSEVSSGVL